jgi:adenylate cyclase class 2
MSTSPTETEIKLAVHNLAVIQRKLLLLRFTLKTARTFESNEIYDTPESTLRNSGSLLRVREYGDEFVLTYKGVGNSGRHKVREEVETRVESPAATRQILQRLGFRIAFRYEKYRTEYAAEGGVAVVDETPIGHYLELEGSPEWIDRTATTLGFSESDYITKSYGTLYNEYRGMHSGAAMDMVFGDGPYQVP